MYIIPYLLLFIIIPYCVCQAVKTHATHTSATIITYGACILVTHFKLFQSSGIFMDRESQYSYYCRIIKSPAE